MIVNILALNLSNVSMFKASACLNFDKEVLSPQKQIKAITNNLQLLMLKDAATLKQNKMCIPFLTRAIPYRI